MPYNFGAPESEHGLGPELSFSSKSWPSTVIPKGLNIDS